MEEGNCHSSWGFPGWWIIAEVNAELGKLLASVLMEITLINTVISHGMVVLRMNFVRSFACHGCAAL